MNLKQIINDSVHTDWKDLLLEIDSSNLDVFLSKQKTDLDGLKDIYPPEPLIFNAFNQFDKKNMKVCYISQDPYFNKGQAMGLCFSVPDGVKLPPSLRNINKEISSDLGIDTSNRNGDLTHWAKQGVLMLNSALTVVEKKPNSHQKQWTPYTDEIIKRISDEMEDIVFILWGNHAQDKIKLIDTQKHHILKGVHPSPLSASRGFFGCKHFSKCNEILTSLGKDPIDW